MKSYIDDQIQGTGGNKSDLNRISDQKFPGIATMAYFNDIH